MPPPDTITAPRPMRLVGTPDAPTVLDARTEEDLATDPRPLPSAALRGAAAAAVVALAAGTAALPATDAPVTRPSESSHVADSIVGFGDREDLWGPRQHDEAAGR